MHPFRTQTVKSLNDREVNSHNSGFTPFLIAKKLTSSRSVLLLKLIKTIDANQINESIKPPKPREHTEIDFART